MQKNASMSLLVESTQPPLPIKTYEDKKKERQDYESKYKTVAEELVLKYKEVRKEKK